MFEKLFETVAVAAKAWVATIGAACVPVVADASQSFVLTVLTALLAGVATWTVPNRSLE